MITEIDECSEQDIWTTKDGQRILISELEDSHLDNIIAMINRNMTRERLELIRLQISFELDAASAMTNGDMASFFLEQDAMRAMDCDDDEAIQYVVPQWDRLLEEQERRKRRRQS